MTITIFSKLDLGVEDYASLRVLLLEDLDELLESPSSEEADHWLIAVLDVLTQLLQADYERKWEDGYLDDILGKFPSWGSEIQQLRRNHRTLLRQVQSLYEALLFESEISEAEQHYQLLKDWMERFASHRQHEREVIQAGFNLVIGGEGG